MPLTPTTRAQLRAIYIEMLALFGLIPPAFPPSSLSNVLIFFSDIHKTNEQAKDAVDNLTKK